MGDRHSSLVLSVPSILRPKVQIPTRPSFNKVKFVLYLSCEMNEKKWLDWPILYRNLTSAILYRSMKEGFINSTEFD